MEPRTAIAYQLNEIFKYIHSTSKNVGFVAKILYYMSPYLDKTKIKIPDLESVIFKNNNRFEQYIISQISEIAESARKSLSKNESNTFQITMSAMTNVCQCFVESRKENISVFPSPKSLFLVNQSDIDSTLDKIYQQFSFIAADAIRNGDQSATNMVLGEYLNIASYFVNIIVNGKRNQLNDMVFAPLYYLKDTTKIAQSHNLDEVVLRGCYNFETFSVNLPKNSTYTDHEQHDPEFYYEIIVYYFRSNKISLINKILEIWLNPLILSIEHNPSRLLNRLNITLDYIKKIIPFALIYEKQYNLDLLHLPVSTPYSLTNNKSLTSFIQESMVLNRIDEKRKHISPYNYFSEFNLELARHFRSVADNYDIGNSGLMWHISSSIKMLIKFHFFIFENSNTNVINYMEDLMKNVTLYISFYWSALNKSKIINSQYAKLICDTLSWIMLYSFTDKINQNDLFQILKHNITDICVSSFSSIVDDYYQKGNDKDHYIYADLILDLWHIRTVAHIFNDISLINRIEANILKLNVFQSKHRQDVLEALVLRHTQLSKQIFDHRLQGQGTLDSAIDILKLFISEKEFFEQQSPVCLYN